MHLETSTVVLLPDERTGPRKSCWLDLFHQLTQTDADRHFKDSMSLSDETCQPFKTSQSLGAHKSSDVVPQSGFFLINVEPIILLMLTALDKSDCYVTRSSKYFLLTSSALCMIWELSVLSPKQIHYLVHMTICKYQGSSLLVTVEKIKFRGLKRGPLLLQFRVEQHPALAMSAWMLPANAQGPSLSGALHSA